MGHSFCTRYSIKLNEKHVSYLFVRSAIEACIVQCLDIEEKTHERGDSYGASSCNFHGELVVSFHSSKFGNPLSLSSGVLDLIKLNINSSPEECYYFFEEEQTYGWHIVEAFGKALPIFEKHAEHRRVAGDAAFSKFHNELYPDQPIGA